MSFGPEAAWGWNMFLANYKGKKVQKTEAADDWGTISFSGGQQFLLSWNAQACGIAVAGESDKKTLLAAAKQTPPLVAALKKHLVGAELENVEQHIRDRVIRFTFRRAVSAEFFTVRHLVFEATERYGNLILTNEENIIIEAAKHIHPDENRFRTILPGFPYTPPPEFKGIALEEWIRSPSKETITQIRGFGAPLLKLLSLMETDAAAEYLSQFYAKSDPDKFLAQRIGKYVTIFPAVLNGSEALGKGMEAVGRKTTLAPLLERDYSSRIKKIEEHLSREIKRRKKQLKDIDALLKLDPNASRKEAELIIANLWRIKQGESSVGMQHWDDEGMLITLPVKLNPLISPQKNARLLFEKYKKLAASQKRAACLQEKVELELAGLDEQLAMVSLVEDTATLAMVEHELGISHYKGETTKKKLKDETSLPPHKRFDLGFALVFTGLSANGNRHVTFNLAAPQDMWFHAWGVPGAHVVLRFTGTPADGEKNTAFNFCASLAVWFSKARENTRARVDCTERKYVSAIRGGIANVTYKNFQSVNASPRFWKEFLANTD